MKADRKVRAAQSRVSEWEKAARLPSLRQLLALFTALGPSEVDRLEPRALWERAELQDGDTNHQAPAETA